MSRIKSALDAGTVIKHPVYSTDYESALSYVLNCGEERSDRTGTGTISAFGLRMEFDLRESFPLITSKRVFWKGVVEELRWMLSGSTNVNDLQKNGVHIWDEWADPVTGDLGPVYGKQWRSWASARTWEHKHGSRVEKTTTIDQIADVINQIKGNPMSRRHIVSAWNVSDLPDMALLPCHLMFQFYVTNDGHLDCQLYQRSGDMFLGVPFNIASYALLTCMIAKVCDLKPGRLIHTIGDAHIYLNHVEQVKEQLSRDARPLPTLTLPIIPMPLESYQLGDFLLEDYNPHPAIKGEVAV